MKPLPSKCPIAALAGTLAWVLFAVPEIAVAAESSTPSWQNLPAVQQGVTLDDCAAKLDSTKGGWCEIRAPGPEPSIGSVHPPNLEKRTRMVVGWKAVLIAWNGGAIDRRDKLLYFFGGGHADYGGNEVYEFDLVKGRWARLTDPSPLQYLWNFGEDRKGRGMRYCWIPDVRKVPASVHTYDGIQLNPRTRTIFVIAGTAASGSCFFDKEGKYADDTRVIADSRSPTFHAIYEFNPSRVETRNGISPLAWRRVSDEAWTYPRSVALPDGSLLGGSHRELWFIDTSNERVLIGGRHSRNAAHSDGLAAYDSQRKVIWSIDTQYLLGLSLQGQQVFKLPSRIPHGKSLQPAKDGRLFTWSGFNQVSFLDPDEKEPKWRTLDWGKHGPVQGDYKVYSKWHYLEDRDLFVGLSSHKTGVWVYRHPKDAPGVFAWSGVDLNSLIKAAKSGTTITIPPGVYGQGLFINKSLTVRLAGVELRGVARGKGVVNVACNGCRVVLEDLEVSGPAANCLTGNCAGIKAEGVDFDLTIRRAHIDNTVMGVVTDNRGGSLRIEASLIENTGYKDRSNTLGHGVYAGAIDSLVIRDSTVRRVFGRGHIIKSRAPNTVLENTKLLGLDGRHSRSIDMPCGGKLVVSNAVINHGAFTDNFDLIFLGAAMKPCGGHVYPGNVSISDSIVVIDRDRSADEPIHTAGPTGLFNWRAELGALHVSGNRIVRSDAGGFVWNHGAVQIPDQSEQNRICRSRAECGLE